MIRFIIITLLLALSFSAKATRVLNIYIWGGIIPKALIQRFEHETNIKVHLSTYDNNETLLAKLRANQQGIYDVILPSAYVVERMSHQGLLMHLDHQHLPNLRYLSQSFTHSDYDPNNQYSIPLIWGATGIFYNQKWVKNPPTTWASLWKKQWQNQLLLLDDSWEVFALSLLSLQTHPNTTQAALLHRAYTHLLALTPNIKLFATESIQALLIDEDVIAGSVWNGDAYKAQQENPAIQFIYPEDGFMIWVDCLSIPANAPHPTEAYAFINFMLNPAHAAYLARTEGHAITNEAGRALLPKRIQHNPMIYPSPETLKRGHMQRDLGEETRRLYNQYWQALKLSF